MSISAMSLAQLTLTWGPAPKEGVGEILILTRIMGFHSLMKLTKNPIYNMFDILSELLFSKIVQQYKMWYLQVQSMIKEYS